MSASSETIIDFGGCHVIAVGERSAARVIVVLLHGFQMEPADLSPFAKSLRVPAWFLFPEAPLAASPRGRAWWHIDAKLRDQELARGPRDFAVQHPPDLPEARACLGTFIDAVLAEAGTCPVVVGGFSQGGMLTCDTLLRRPRPVAGVVLLSASRLAFDEWAPFLAAGNVRDLPFLVSHGTADPDLAFSAGDALKSCLAEAGAKVTWVPFDQGHEIPLVVWRGLRRFLQRIVAT